VSWDDFGRKRRIMKAREYVFRRGKRPTPARQIPMVVVKTLPAIRLLTDVLKPSRPDAASTISLKYARQLC
jgi:hypothetical protein